MPREIGIGSKTSLSVTLRELPSRVVTHRLTGMEPSLSYIGVTTARVPAWTFGLRQADLNALENSLR